MSVLCRDCFTLVEEAPARRCPACRSPRLVRHEEIATLAMAHVDCDAFYATVEKRDNPALADKPVIIDGGKRGVVSAACYVARTFGVKSAMPMFKALAACPNAVVIRPDMQKYAGVGREVRQRDDERWRRRDFGRAAALVRGGSRGSPRPGRSRWRNA